MNEVYLTSFYFTVTTLVTVGYGDITGYNKTEKVWCIFLMMFGIVSFSIMSGAITSMITSLDSKSAILKEKIYTLNNLLKTYKLSDVLYNKLARCIKYDHGKKGKHN